MPFRVFIAFGGPPGAMEHSLPVVARNPISPRAETGDKIAGVTASGDVRIALQKL